MSQRAVLGPSQTEKMVTQATGSMIWMALLLGLAGCASAPLGRSIVQEIRVETPGCPGVRCELRNDRGAWIVEHTPGSVSVTSSDKPLEVRCMGPETSAGSTRSQAGQREGTGSGTAAGAAVGGGIAAAAAAPAIALGGPFAFLGVTLVIIGAGIGGAMAQAADASRREFSYPTLVQVAMQCALPSGDAVKLAAPTWGLMVRGAQAGDGAPAGAVWVTSVVPGGRAAAAGLQAGDLLLAIDGRPLDGTSGLEDDLVRLQAPAMVLLRRAGDMRQLALDPKGRT
jgi:PDZ domain